MSFFPELGNYQLLLSASQSLIWSNVLHSQTKDNGNYPAILASKCYQDIITLESKIGHIQCNKGICFSKYYVRIFFWAIQLIINTWAFTWKNGPYL